jgi:hypothetical protein
MLFISIGLRAERCAIAANDSDFPIGVKAGSAIRMALTHTAAAELLADDAASLFGRRLEHEGVVFHIAGTQIQKRTAVIGRRYELQSP